MIQAAPGVGRRLQRVLVVGDGDGQVCHAVREAFPEARATAVPSVFEAIAELQGGDFQAVLMNVEPVERRAESAMRALREQLDQGESGEGRLVVFAGPGHEPLSRRLVEAGGDDYLVLPAEADEVRRALDPAPTGDESRPEDAAEGPAPLPAGPDLAAIVLSALLEHPGNVLAEAVSQISQKLPEGVSLELLAERPEPPLPSQRLPEPADGWLVVYGCPPAAAEAQLRQLAPLLARAAELDSRHQRLQHLALTDGLTGCYNVRYFRRYLDKLLARARRDRFAVTLLLFDIDDFKRYNDTHGHGVGDAILKQTAELIKRCIRDHDLVARIGGDEFAVVFWEKEAPRIPHDPDQASGSRFPRGPLQIAARFRRLMNGPEFDALGVTGQGHLSISGGMAVFPFDAQSTDALIEAADKALIFGAKRGGKNSISLVGGESPESFEEEAAD